MELPGVRVERAAFLECIKEGLVEALSQSVSPRVVGCDKLVIYLGLKNEVFY